jgi:predicted enzyme related to lactoylglutathione lyase
MYQNTPPVGTIVWRDLTVPDAAAIRDFYARVVGWRAEPVSMGNYNDFNMLPPDGSDPAAGICYARGTNADLPPQWLMYIVVDDVDQSAAVCVKLGGAIVAPAHAAWAADRFCVIRDPAGAVCALSNHRPPRDAASRRLRSRRHPDRLEADLADAVNALIAELGGATLSECRRRHGRRRRRGAYSPRACRHRC